MTTMKFVLPLLVVATQLIGCSDGAAQELCPVVVTVTNYDALTWETVANYKWAFGLCVLRDYRSYCLNNEFRQRVSEDDFVTQSFLGNQVFTTDDLISPIPAHCVSPFGLVTLDPGERTSVRMEVVNDGNGNQRVRWNRCSNPYCDQVASNPFTGATSGGGRHNRLLNQIEEFGISSLDEQALQNFDDKCGDYEVSCCCSCIRNPFHESYLSL